MVGDLITSSARFLITQFPPAIQYCNVVVIMVDKWSDALPFTFLCGRAMILVLWKLKLKVNERQFSSVGAGSVWEGKSPQV